MPADKPRLRLFIAAIATFVSNAAAYDLATTRAAMRLSPCVMSEFKREGCVVLRKAATSVPPPTHHPGRESTKEEESHQEAECSFAAALACILLDAPALYDPAGPGFATCCDHSFGHYQTAHLLDLPAGDMAIVRTHSSLTSFWLATCSPPSDTFALPSLQVLLPREPMTLVIGSCLPRHEVTAASVSCLVHKRTSYAAFSSSGEVGDHFESDHAGGLPASAVVDLDPGDAVILAGDHSAFTTPPDGLGAGQCVYRFAACDATDEDRLFCSPMHHARMKMSREHLMRSLDSRDSQEQEIGSASQ